tara:strand:+ start:39 stop:353 length:315 start_codon:yes stop_codon:yes gene_type:complete
MSTYRFECPKCDIEIITQGHELTECLYCRVTTDNTQTLYNALAELKNSQEEVSRLSSVIEWETEILDKYGEDGFGMDQNELCIFYNEREAKLTNNQASETEGEG